MDESQPMKVISKDGTRGTIVDATTTQTDVTHVLVRFETGQQMLVPTDALTLQADGSYYYLGLRQDELVQEHSAGTHHPDEPLMLPVIAERIVVQKQKRVTGRVRITKAVEQREEVVDEPLLRNTVQVERVPINRVVEREMPVRYEGDTMIIPVLEEVLVVEKRLMLKEELHITQRQEQIHQPQRIILQNENITVDRVLPSLQPDAEPVEQSGSMDAI